MLTPAQVFIRRVIKFIKQQVAPQKNTFKTKNTSLRERRLSRPDQLFPTLNYSDEVQARKAVELVENHTMTTYECMITLWNQVRYLDCAEMQGSLVECGTWRGGACGMMALAHIAGGKPWRTIHLFDSFEGLPEPDASMDGKRAVQYASSKADGNLKSIERCIGPLEVNQQLMRDIVKYPEELTKYHVGWFENTIPPVKYAIGPIALLRLDGDWYASTKVCLENFFPLVQPGGIVVIDDYGHWEGCRKAVDEYIASLPYPLFLNYVDEAARYIIISR